MRICIASPHEDAPTETFIRAHIEKLPADKLILTDGDFPRRAGGKPFVPRISRVLSRYWQRLPGPVGRYGAEMPTRALARVLAAHRIDVALAEFGVTGSQITEACRRASVPLVTHFLGFDAYERSTLEVSISSYQRMFEYASALIAVSAHMCDQLKAIGAPEKKVFYVPCGVDLTMFTQADPASAPPQFLAVGRFVDKKAPYLTVVAFREALRQCPEVRLIMAGDGPLLECSKQLAVAIGAAHAIEFPGVLSHATVAELMQRSRALLQHYITPNDRNSEGTPLVVLEAAASGLPVISTIHAGVPEAVVHGTTGLLVQERDIVGMARHIVTLARAPAYARELGAHAREHVAHKYASNRCISRLAAILKWAASREDVSNAPARRPEWWGEVGKP